jgi:SAM-dependent methyltransferase
MEVEKYREMSLIENRHWWFRGRRSIFSSILQDMGLDKGADILEVGCGTGGNLSLLKQFGDVCAAEMDDFSREHAQSVSGLEVEYCKLPGEIPFANKRFDLICLFDVLEHINEDDEALIMLRGRLKENGKILITVPATKWLFGGHDEMLHHFRRYSRSELEKKVLASGLVLSSISYFNTFLFPLAVVARIIDCLPFKNNSVGMDVPPRLINNLFYNIFRFEQFFLKNSLFPFGLSLLVVASAE